MSAADPARRLAESSRRGYGGDWDLFTDWCAAFELAALPAQPQTLAQFFDQCHAHASTLRRRAAAINRAHLDNGFAPPGRDPAIIDVLRAARGLPALPSPAPPGRAAVNTALRLIPTDGWPSGLFGRRDQCLLLLTGLAGLPYPAARRLTARQVRVQDGDLVIHTEDGQIRLGAAAEAVICPPCVFLRWWPVLDRAVAAGGIARVLRRPLQQAPPVPGHACQHDCSPDGAGADVALLPGIDQYGYLRLPVFGAVDSPGQAMSARSMAAVVNAALARTPISHRRLDVPEQPRTPQTPEPVLAVPSPADLRAWHETALARQRHDRQRLSDLDEMFTRIDAHTDAINRRLAQLAD